MKPVRKTQPQSPLYFNGDGIQGTQEGTDQQTIQYVNQIPMQRAANLGALQDSNPLSVSYDSGSNTYTVTIASHSLLVGSDTIAYSSGSIVGLASFGSTYFIYADDPYYEGGSVTYVATLTARAELSALDGRYFVGSATIGSSGGGGTTSGGPGGGGIIPT